MGERLVVGPVGRRDRVGGSQVGADTGRDGFLPGGEVHLTGNRSRGDVERGCLALHVDLHEGLLEDADPHHLAVHLAQRLVVGHHGPPWVVSWLLVFAVASRPAWVRRSPATSSTRTPPSTVWMRARSVSRSTTSRSPSNATVPGARSSIVSPRSSTWQSRMANRTSRPGA